MNIFLLLVLGTFLIMPVVAIVALWTSIKLLRVREPHFGMWLAITVGAMIASNIVAIGLSAVSTQMPLEYLAATVAAIALTLVVSFITIRYRVAWYKVAGVFVLCGVLMLATDIASRAVIGATVTKETTVTDDGMLPAIGVGDNVMSIRLWPYYVRGDLVEIHSGANERVVIRRIVGLPGEKIELIHGELFVNDKPTPVPSSGKVMVDGATIDVPAKYRDGATSVAAHMLENGEYFVLADNPELRSGAANGPVRKTGDVYIKGKVVFKVRGVSRFSEEGIHMYPLE